MNAKQLTLAFGATLVLSACFSANNEDSNSGIVPAAENFFYSIPTAVASEAPSESLVVIDEMGAARMSEAGDSVESGSVFDAYKPVPAYIHLAETAKNQVKDLVEELRSYEIPAEFDAVENGLRIRSKTVDTTILGAEQKLFVIDVKTEADDKQVMFMNYWKNARGQYRGNFFYTERDPSAEHLGAAIHVHFNGHNEGIYGKRMMVTFYQPKENLTNPNDPTVVRVWSRKKGDRIFVTGASYHPNFVDEFWPEGAKVYAFRTVANTDKDRAVLRVAFADAQKDLSNIFQDYPLDKVVTAQFVEKYRAEINANDSLALAVAWSLENEKDLIAMYTAMATDKFVAPTLDVSSLTVEQFLKFIEINKAFLREEAAKKGDQGLTDLLRFIEMEQPIFLVKGGVIIGGKHHAIGSDFGVNADELESTDLTDITFKDLGDFDPDNLEEPNEIEE